MNRRIDHKAGATFELECTLEFDDTPVDISGWDISASVKDRNGELVACCDVAITDAANGAFTLSVDDTSDWPTDEHLMDIRYDFNGTTMYSESLFILVTEAVTVPGDC